MDRENVVKQLMRKLGRTYDYVDDILSYINNAYEYDEDTNTSNKGEVILLLVADYGLNKTVANEFYNGYLKY